MDETSEYEVFKCASRVRFDFACPKRWDALELMSEPRQRFCGVCESVVRWCDSVVEADLRAEQGECIAIPAHLVRRAEEGLVESAGIVIGRPKKLVDLIE